MRTLREYRHAINAATREHWAIKNERDVSVGNVDEWLRRLDGAKAAMGAIWAEAQAAYPDASWGQLVYQCADCKALPPIVDGVELPCENGCDPTSVAHLAEDGSLVWATG